MDVQRNSVTLKGQVALVTGASRGVGRGVAVGLANAGATVFATGRTIKQSELGPGIETFACDHTDDQAVEAVFRRVTASAGRLDVLVNVAWGGYERMVENGQFTYIAPFWQQPLWRWDAMVTTGVRGAFVASQHAARMMVPARRGLIVNISFWAAQKYLGNTVYGIAKAATDKMTSDMAHELKLHGVTVVSLYPGLVRRSGAGGQGLRSEQLRKPGVHRPSHRRVGSGPERVESKRRHSGGSGGCRGVRGHRR